MSVTCKKFGTLNSLDVYSYTLDNGCGLVAEILNYGGIIRKLIYQGTDVVLGRDSIEEYMNNEGYFGAIIGRNSNRISNSEFMINGTLYKLYANDGNNNLHGGKEGFDKKIWNCEFVDNDEPSVVLTYSSPDGEEGFPGNADIKVTYTLTKNNSIKIKYEGQCDKDTIINLTNHSYFNLNGHSSGTIDNHVLMLESEYYTPNSSECMPYGEILKTVNTPFCFDGKKTFKEAFDSECEQIKMFGGVDHNVILKGKGFRYVGFLLGDISKIKMNIYTDQKGVQIYTGNVINDKRVCKEGVVYPVHGAVCLETQDFPDSANIAHFPSPVLKKGEKYESYTEYCFEKIL